MPSPFPGMDPWLDDPLHFPDMHDALMGYLREALNALLPAGYKARGRHRVVLGRSDPRVPDVGVLSRTDRPTRTSHAMTVDYAAVGMLRVPTAVPDEESYLEISTAEGRLVTSLEIVSASNKKPGTEHRRAYLAKQRRTLRAGVGLVEIDLLRAGRHCTAIPVRKLRALRPESIYHVCVCGAAVGPAYQIAAVSLSDRLPLFAVPLDIGIAPVRIDLQLIFERSFDTGRYGDLDYSRPARPPLTPDQQAWAEEILRKRGT
jgi:hypothetical protein